MLFENKTLVEIKIKSKEVFGEKIFATT